MTRKCVFDSSTFFWIFWILWNLLIWVSTAVVWNKKLWNPPLWYLAAFLFHNHEKDIIVSTDSVPDMIDMALCVIKCLVLCCATLATWADQRDSLVQGVQKKVFFLSYVLRSKQNWSSAHIQKGPALHGFWDFEKKTCY